jgi:hypothetical protein
LEFTGGRPTQQQLSASPMSAQSVSPRSAHSVGRLMLMQSESDSPLLSSLLSHAGTAARYVRFCRYRFCATVFAS